MRFRNVIFAGAFALMLLLGLLGALDASGEPALVTAAAPDTVTPLDQAVTWLIGQQEADGGFGSAGVTADVVLGLVAAGREPRLVQTVTGTTPLDYLMSYATEYADAGPAEAGKLALAAAASNADPTDFGGVDLIATLWNGYSATTGVFAADPYTATTTWDQAFAMLAIAAVQETVPAAAAQALIDWQEPDGSWGFTLGSAWGGDPDSTALAMMALQACSDDAITGTSVALDDAVTYLRNSQLASGGWGWSSASPDSTAVVIQALAALGYVPATWSWTTPAGGNPQADLLALQLPGGAFPDFMNSPNVMATAHALPGLAEVPFPILGRSAMAQRALAWLSETQNDDGGFGDLGSGPSPTADIVMAFAAAGVDAKTVLSSQGNTPIDYLVSQVPTYSRDGGEVGKLVLAAVAANLDPRDFGGYDLTISLTNHISPSGQLNTSSCFRQSLGILGLNSASVAVPPTVTQWLKDQQLPGGGWEWAVGSGWGADTDTTALVIQALISAGEAPTSTIIANAIDYLHSVQNPDAGFGSGGFSPETSSDSTAYVIQALVAAGEDLIMDWVQNGRTPLVALQSMQKSDGPFVYQWDNQWFGSADNLMSTLHSVPGLLELAFPLNVVPQSYDFDLNHAGLVVDYDDGQVDRVCVPFAEPEITGLELLNRSGIPYLADNGFVVKIGDVGCELANPYCGDPVYWMYWNGDGAGGWVSSMIGAAATPIDDGSVDGWRWQNWSDTAPPAAVPSMARICGLLDLVPFEPVFQGPDPDRLVTAPMWAEQNGSVEVYVPFGSDLNEDAVGTFGYRAGGSSDWVAATMVRADGVFTVVLPVTSLEDLVFRASFRDSDGIQGDFFLSNEYLSFLPLVTR